MCLSVSRLNENVLRELSRHFGKWIEQRRLDKITLKLGSDLEHIPVGRISARVSSTTLTLCTFAAVLVQRSIQYQPMLKRAHLLLAGNQTVPISLSRG